MLCSYSFSSFVFINKYPVVENRKNQPCSIRHLKVSEVLTNANACIKPGTNARNPEPKSGIKFCQPNMGTKHACIKLKFIPNIDYRLFL